MSSSKRVSTSHIPPVFQPTAFFVDQRTDKSFYLLHPSFSFSATLDTLSSPHCVKTLISLVHQLIISHTICAIATSLTPCYFCLYCWTHLVCSHFSAPPSPVWQFLLHLFSLPQQSGAWEPTSLICVPVHAELLLVCSCRSGRVRHYYMFISSENVYAWSDMCCFTSVLLLYVIIGPYRTSDGGNQQKCMCVCTTGDTSGRDRAGERCFTMYQLYHSYVNLGRNGLLSAG